MTKINDLFLKASQAIVGLKAKYEETHGRMAIKFGHATLTEPPDSLWEFFYKAAIAQYFVEQEDGYCEVVIEPESDPTEPGGYALVYRVFSLSYQQPVNADEWAWAEFAFYENSYDGSNTGLKQTSLGLPVENNNIRILPIVEGDNLETQQYVARRNFHGHGDDIEVSYDLSCETWMIEHGQGKGVLTLNLPYMGDKLILSHSPHDVDTLPWEQGTDGRDWGNWKVANIPGAYQILDTIREFYGA